ncbi:TfoX/Sxy family DNA transformation protein, partial [Neisseria sp. P0019.S002]
MLTTPPVAPQTLAALQALGIRSVEELRDTGSVQAFLLLKAAGLTVTRSTLWQLEALLLGIKSQELPQTQKTALEQAVKNHPPVAVFPTSSEMETFMRAALAQAEQSVRIGEI